MAKNLQSQKRVSVKTLARMPKYGVQRVTKLASSTGIYGKFVGGNRINTGVRVRGRSR